MVEHRRNAAVVTSTLDLPRSAIRDRRGGNVDKKMAIVSRDEWLARAREAAPEITQEQRAVAVRVLSRAGRPSATEPPAPAPATREQPARSQSGTQSAA